jgi:DNA-nicking Smr family endonuclease
MPRFTDPPAAPPEDHVAFRRPGVRDDDWRRLQRGQLRVDAEIDLHGLRLHEAQAALREFVQESTGLRLRCVRIIHGKGLRSGVEGPVLKHAVAHWLRGCDEVRAFVTARPADGGSGAVYALLG